jgi:predicted NAD/FAD-binding protein
MRQVRSVTLDTWLPEQVDFISGMNDFMLPLNWAILSSSFRSFHVFYLFGAGIKPSVG